MKILLSAFACSPKWGSETGVGWYWAVELAKSHEVTVLLHDHFRHHVAELPADAVPPGLTFEYIALDPIRGPFYEELLNSQLYYIRWQWLAFRRARELVQRTRFDVVHHLTWGTFRFPSWLGFLGLPFVMGPVGGAERAPWGLYAGLPLKERLRELARDVVIYSSKADLLTLTCLSRASVIYCKTRQTRDILPGFLRKKVALAQEIGSPTLSYDAQRQAYAPGARPLRLLYAGRLLGLKGIHLALGAVARAVKQGVSLHFTIIGSGPMESHFRAMVAELNLQQHVEFVPKIPQQELFQRYLEADAFLFPSLHDSSGNVVLESLSRGLPVICLELGGPAEFVDASCGFVVPVAGQSAAQVQQGLSEVLLGLSSMPPQGHEALRDGAYQRAASLSWRNQIEGLYADIRSRLRIR